MKKASAPKNVVGKKLVLSRETLRTVAPSHLGEIGAGLFFWHPISFGSVCCETVTGPDTGDGLFCQPW
jgi:hypothetical protein